MHLQSLLKWYRNTGMKAQLFKNTKLPFHYRFCSSVTVQSSEFALPLNSCSNTVGEVLPAVRDNVPGHTVLGGESTRTRTQPAKGCQVWAQPQVQGDGAAIYPQVCKDIDEFSDFRVKYINSPLRAPHKEIPDRGQFRSWNKEWNCIKKTIKLLFFL